MPSQFALAVKMLTSTGTERKGGEIKTKSDGLSESTSRQHSLDAMAKRVPTCNNDTCRKDWKIICTNSTHTGCRFQDAALLAQVPRERPMRNQGTVRGTEQFTNRSIWKHNVSGQT